MLEKEFIFRVKSILYRKIYIEPYYEHPYILLTQQA